MTEGTFSSIEAESLPAHVAACAERYKSLFNRLTRIERILFAIAFGLFSMIFTVIGAVVIALLNKGLGV